MKIVKLKGVDVDFDTLTRSEIRGINKADLVEVMIQLQSDYKMRGKKTGYQLIVRNDEELKLAMMVIFHGVKDVSNFPQYYHASARQLIQDGCSGLRLYKEKDNKTGVVDYGYDWTIHNSRMYLQESNLETLIQELDITIDDWVMYYGN